MKQLFLPSQAPCTMHRRRQCNQSEGESPVPKPSDWVQGGVSSRGIRDKAVSEINVGGERRKDSPAGNLQRSDVRGGGGHETWLREVQVGASVTSAVESCKSKEVAEMEGAEKGNKNGHGTYNSSPMRKGYSNWGHLL